MGSALDGRTRLQRLADGYGGRVGLDYIIAGTVTVAHVAAVWHWRHGDLLREMGLSRRVELYGDAIVAVGIFIGLTGAALTSYVTLAGPRIAAVRRLAGDDLARQWRAALNGPALALPVLVVAFVCDSDSSAAAGIRWGVEAALVLVGLRFARLLRIFGELVSLDGQDRADDRGDPAPIQLAARGRTAAVRR